MIRIYFEVYSYRERERERERRHGEIKMDKAREIFSIFCFSDTLYNSRKQF
jgi:hypothetical protein